MSGGRLPTTQPTPGTLGGYNPAGRRRQLAAPVVLRPGPAQGLEHTDDRALDAVQRRTADASGQARSSVIAAHVFLQGVVLASGVPQTLSHGLGRAFVSCMLCGQSAYGSIAVQRPAPRTRPLSARAIADETSVTITPDFNGVADVLVF